MAETEAWADELLDGEVVSDEDYAQRDYSEAHIAKRQEYIKGLRDLANWMEAHPELPIPDSKDQWFYAVGTTPGLDIRGEMQMFARAFPKCEKEYRDEQFWLVARSGSLIYRVTCQRANVCKRVVVGTEHVPRQVTPAQTIPEKVIEAHDKDVVEWQCEPLLLSRGRADEILPADPLALEASGDNPF